MTFEDRDKYGMYKQTGKTGPGPALMGADTLLGEDVVNRNGDDLGDIKEIMIDMRSGQVAYAVLSFGGILGIGEKLFAVPWEALQLDTVNKRFVLDVSKDRLESAPGFDADAWPDMTDVSWSIQIHNFYGTDPSRSGSMGTMPMGAMSGSAGMGAGAGSMGAGHAGTSGTTDAGSMGSGGAGGGTTGSSGSSGS
jgi:sporulation protein YlmC with PRC-barrel domain